MEKSVDAFRTISEAASDLGVPQHVLRFWETRFAQIKPMKRGGGRRYYRPDDIALLKAIRYLLYGEGYTIRGVQRLLKDHGQKAVISMASEGVAPIAIPADLGEAMVQADDTDEDPAPATPRANAFSSHVTAQTSAEYAARYAATMQAILAELAECSRILAAAEASD